VSVIRKKPYIEKVVSRLNATNLTALQTILDDGGSNTNTSVDSLGNKGVKAVYFKFDDTDIKTGILIYTDYTLSGNTLTQCVLICYHRFQDLQMYEINLTTHNIKKINEYLDINELRRVLLGINATCDARAVVDPNDDDIIIYNEGMQVDNNGDVTIGRDLYVEDEIVIDDLTKIADTDGNSLIWTGTQAEYDALESHNPTTLYICSQED